MDMRDHLNHQPNLVDLVAGYQAYTSAEELNGQPVVVEAPSTPLCAWAASAAASAVGGATYKLGC